MRCFTCTINRSYFPAICRKTFPLKNKRNSKLQLEVRRASGGNAGHFAATVSFRILLPQPKIHKSFLAIFQANGVICNTIRWFKHDRDCLCVNLATSVPAIFEPPCIFNLIIFTFLSHDRYFGT